MARDPSPTVKSCYPSSLEPPLGILLWYGALGATTARSQKGKVEGLGQPKPTRVTFLFCVGSPFSPTQRSTSKVIGRLDDDATVVRQRSPLKKKNFLDPHQ